MSHLEKESERTYISTYGGPLATTYDRDDGYGYNTCLSPFPLLFFSLLLQRDGYGYNTCPSLPSSLFSPLLPSSSLFFSHLTSA